MRICAFSDMHGQIGFDIEPCDVALICGDIVPLGIQSYTDPSVKWLRDKFIPWCQGLPCERVLFIAGNHDFLMFRHPERVRELLKGQDKVVYLECQDYEYGGKVFYGTPLCKPFGRWAFMPSYEEQDERYARHLGIMGSVDVVMSHDTPYGVSDVILQEGCPWADGSHIGNESLRRFLDSARPRLCVHGHIHSSEHGEELIGDSTSVYNVSLLDEDYNMRYKPLYLEI